MKTTLRGPLLLVALGVLLAAFSAACQSVPAATDTDLESLQGRWEGHGPGGECSVTISGNSLDFYARDDFWFETEFTLPADTDPPQLHATITNESLLEGTIGTVVVALFKIEDGALTLGVLEDFDGPPQNPVTGHWDDVTDLYHLKRVRSQ